MMLELNDVLLNGETQTLSMMAYEGQLTCIAGGTVARRTNCLYGLLGFVPILGGYVSIDGEPLTVSTISAFRQLMSFVPRELCREGQVRSFVPPTIEDVLNLKENRNLMVTASMLSREVKQMGGSTSDQAQWLALAVLRDKPILLVDSPLPEFYDYLRWQAGQGTTVVVASDDDVYGRRADVVVRLS